MAKKPRQSIASSASTPIDFKVDPATGIGYISQRKAAELCGVSRNAIVHFCSGKFDISQGLSDEQLSFVVHHYAKQKRSQAIDTLFLFAQAGARAFIYSQAGVKVQIAQQATEQLVLQLQDENAKLKSEAAANALSFASLKCNKAVRHTELQGLVERGIATCTQKVVTRYKYGLTREGREEGFTQNSNGTILYPSTEG